MKIGVICPHRNDRPEFLVQFEKYIQAQTLQPDQMFYINYPPESGEVDITQRYRLGYEAATLAGMDIVLLMEVDDYYSPTYIESMVSAWNDAKQPSLITIGNSYYYHISGRWFNIALPSANTFLLRTGLQINWGADNYAYADVTLLGQLPRVYWTPETPICVGIKHGIGLVGGGSHNADNERYVNEDDNGEWLRGVVGESNFEFYKSLKEKVC